jgi:hypothetical protein
MVLPRAIHRGMLYCCEGVCRCLIICVLTGFVYSLFGSQQNTPGVNNMLLLNSLTMSSMSTLNSSRHKGTPKALLHTLSISAAVTVLRWRPPAGDLFVLEDEDRHNSMLSVATAPINVSGGSGQVSLWSYNRPFMPLSVVEGHKEGAVTDFDWLDTPQPEQAQAPTGRSSASKQSAAVDSRRFRRGEISDGSESTHFRTASRVSGGSSHGADSILFDNGESEDVNKPVGIWQHVLSVGRDGCCLLQSFARG